MFNLEGPMMQEIDMEIDEALHSSSVDDAGVRHWRDVVFATPAGFRPLTLHIAVPKADGPVPLVIFIHGGAWLFGHPMVTNPVYRKLDPFGKLLRAGFAVARIAYRFSGEGPFPLQLHDCKAAVRFLRNWATHFGIDARRFAAMGDSAGGHLASLLGLTGQRADMEGAVGEVDGSSAVQAVVNWFGPANLLTMQAQATTAQWQDHNDPNSPESQLVGGPVQSNKELARAASPVHYVGADAPPFLIQHGTLDRLVPLAQSQELHEALVQAGRDSTLTAIAGADHCFWGVDGAGIVEADIAFLRAKLK
jgi:acetyl esterase/lipase